MSNDIIKVKRSNEDQKPALLQGEPFFGWDKELLSIGGLTGAVKIGGFTDGDFNIYVDPFGSDSFSGLKSDEPFKSIQKAFDLIEELAYKGSNQKFVINLADGTYEGGASVTGVVSTQRIHIKGNVDLSNIPLAVIDGTIGSPVFGMIFTGKMNLLIENVKVINIVTGSNSGTGIQVQDNGDVWFKNVHIDNCDFVGLYCNSNCKMRVTGGVYRNCQRAIRAYSATSYSIGYQSSGDRVDIANCDIGVEVRDTSSGRVDYCDIDACETGVWAYQNVRAHLFSCNITNCTKEGVLATSGAQWYNDDNTFSGNTVDVSQGAFAAELDFNRSGSKVTYCGSFGNVFSKTGITTEEKFLSLKSFTKAMFNAKGNKFKVKIKGQFEGLGNKTLKCRVNGTSIGQYVSSVDSLQEFEIEFDFVSLGGDTQLAFWSAQEGDGNNKFMFKYDSTIPVSTLSVIAFELWSSATNAASVIRIDDITVEYFPYASDADVITQP